MPEIVLRLAHPADAPAIGEIHAAGIALVNPVVTLQIEKLEDYAGFIASHQGDYPLYVATIDDHVAGWACLSAFSPMVGFWPTAEASWYVHPDFKGQGVGKALAKHLVHHAQTTGRHTNILARIASTNEPSLRIVQGLGFDFFGTIYKAGERSGWVDVSFWILPLFTTADNKPAKLA